MLGTAVSSAPQHEMYCFKASEEVLLPYHTEDFSQYCSSQIDVFVPLPCSQNEIAHDSAGFNGQV